MDMMHYNVPGNSFSGSLKKIIPEEIFDSGKGNLKDRKDSFSCKTVYN